VDGARVAADRGRHAGAHQQSEPGGPVRRQHGASGIGEHDVRIGRASDGHRGHPAHPHRHAADHRVPQLGLGAIEQRHGMPDATGQRGGARGGHEVLRAPLRRGVELRRALQRSGSGRVPAAGRRMVGGARQCLRRHVVRRGGGGGAVPSAPIGVGAVVERGSQRLVRGPALGEAGGAVDRRAQQRMAEAHPRAIGRQQAGALDGVEGVGAHADALRGAQQRPDLAAVVGRREQEHPSRVVRQRRHPGHEGLLDALIERQVEAQRCAARELVVAERAGQLEQGEWIAAGDADELLAHDRGQGAVEEACRLGCAQPRERQLGQPGRVEMPRVTLARPDEHGDRIGLQAPGDEDERVGGGAVEPVRVVDHAEQWLRIGRRREQAEHGHRDDEAILDAVRGQAEGAAQGGSLDVGELVGEVEDGPQHLVQSGERQLGLGLDAGAREHAHPPGACHGALQQRGLADARLAAQDEDAAARAPGPVEQAVDRRALALSPQQHAPTLRRPTRGPN
jgi:hypothetical protein